jgi:hypothetical protein
MLEALRPFSKAVAATLAGALVSWLMKHNIIVADGLADALEVLISAAIVGTAVYFAPKNKEVK